MMKVQGLRTVPFKIVGEVGMFWAFWVETSLSLLLTFFGPPPIFFTLNLHNTVNFAKVTLLGDFFGLAEVPQWAIF